MMKKRRIAPGEQNSGGTGGTGGAGSQQLDSQGNVIDKSKDGQDVYRGKKSRQIKSNRKNDHRKRVGLLNAAKKSGAARDGAL